jgi:fatty acid kinase fatty acid binding subunit
VLASSQTGDRAFPAPGLVAVVTDSTASLPADEPGVPGVIVVPQRLLAGDFVADDGDLGAAADIEAAAARGVRLTTARPAPAQFAAAYRRAGETGARAVVSVHLSGTLSGTVSSAALAAAAAPIPVRVIDTRAIGSGLGLVVLAAVAAASAGQGLDAVASAASACASQVGSFFAVDRPDALLAGGRASGAGPADGQLAEPGVAAPRLVSRTVLRLDSGRIGMVDRVRTWSGAAALLTRSAVEIAAGLPTGTAADVVVEHVAAAGRADGLEERLRAGLPQARRVSVVAASTAIRVHTGPMMLGVSVAPSPAVG